MHRSVVFGIIFTGLTVAALGQGSGVQRSEFSLQVSGVFTAGTHNAPTTHVANHSAGLLAGYRFHINSWEAVEVEYGYTRNGQNYFTPGTAPGSPGINHGITANMQEAIANEVITTPRIGGFLQPFIVAGGGLVFFNPRGPSSIALTHQKRGAGNFGVGVDFHIMHIGARVEFQELLFKVPDFGNPLLTTDKWTHVAQPSVGLVLTF
ncbi:MAG TPA: hypothetical protein VNE83_02960 [Terriglobales bacterium]|nr:hypothetical protein [Terriglobales bacterium]